MFNLKVARAFKDRDKEREEVKKKTIRAVVCTCVVYVSVRQKTLLRKNKRVGICTRAENFVCFTLQLYVTHRSEISKMCSYMVEESRVLTFSCATAFWIFS